jgi:hypothetical protein
LSDADTFQQHTVLKNIYAQLELRFGLLRETTPKYTAYSYTALGDTTKDKSPAAQAIRSTARKAKTLYHIDVDAASRSSRLSRTELVAKLNDWHDKALIDLRTSGVVNLYRVLSKLPTMKADQRKIIDSLYAELEAREQQDLDRGQQVMDLINGSACFSAALARHFGDSLPDGKTECGHCTWCETHKPVKVITPQPKPLDQAALDKILKAIPDRDDPRYLARIAFGISSPRVTQAKLGKDPLFGSMEEYDFMVCIHWRICAT